MLNHYLLEQNIHQVIFKIKNNLKKYNLKKYNLKKYNLKKYIFIIKNIF
jgi:hypothetical protein